MVRHDDVCRCGASARAMDEALLRVEGASVMDAVRRADGQHTAGDETPTNTQRVEITLENLRGIGVSDRYGRQHVRAHGVLRAVAHVDLRKGQFAGCGSLEPQETRVVVVTLQSAEAHAVREDRIESWQLMGDKLVRQGIRLRRDADGHVVPLGELDCR